MRLVATLPNPAASRYRSAGHWPDRPLGKLFAQTVARHPEGLAIVDAAHRLTFAELDRLSRATAQGLHSLGFGPGDVIAFQLPNWWEAVVVFLATLRLGATVNPLLPIFREAELRFTLQQSGAQALVIPGVYRGCDYRELIAGLRHEVPALRAVFVARDEPPAEMHSFDSLLESADGVTLQSAISPDSIALLMYTSGTTAAPKGVLHSHNTLAAEVLSLERVHQLAPADRTLMPSPLTHISGVIHGILAPALLGTSAVLMDRWGPARAAELIEREDVTYMVGAPTFLQDLLAQLADTADLRSLRLFSCGGAGVSPALVRHARERLPHCVTKRVYGSTEFPTLTTTDAGDALTHGIETEGRAISPAEVRIADESGTALPPGQEGEVQGCGPECFVGYLDPTLNADTFTPDGWFRTGDLGVLDAAGYLRITGRLKEIIIRKGEKISVQEVEDAIAAHPAVAEVAVIALPDPDTGERACAFVRLRPTMSIDLATLTAFLATTGLAKQKWPERLEVVDTFPRTESGKILRKQLPGARAHQRVADRPVDTRGSYDRVADEYVRRIFDELQHKPLDRQLLDRVAAVVAGPLADVGCGPGHVARYLHERGAQVLGVDLSPAMVERARQLNPGIMFEQGDMRALDAADAAWAGIVAFYSIIHIPRAEVVTVLREFHRVLQAGGLLLLAFHVGEQMLHLDEWLAQSVSVDFYFFTAVEMTGYLRSADFVVEEVIEREPYPDVEHQSRRAYILARRPG